MEATLIDNQSREQFVLVFGGIELLYQKASLGKGNAHAFSVKIDSEERLKEIWQPVSNFIALQYQTKISDSFGKYNFYLFYIVMESVSNELKYKIENNTFSCRKIVVGKEEALNYLINSHILNSDLEIEHENVVGVDTFNKNQQLWNKLQGKVLKSVRMTSAATDTYNELLSSRKCGPDEI